MDNPMAQVYHETYCNTRLRFQRCWAGEPRHSENVSDKKFNLDRNTFLKIPPHISSASSAAHKVKSNNAHLALCGPPNQRRKPATKGKVGSRINMDPGMAKGAIMFPSLIQVFIKIDNNSRVLPNGERTVAFAPERAGSGCFEASM